MHLAYATPYAIPSPVLNGLNTLMQPVTAHYTGCDNTDYYWYQQSGTDNLPIISAESTSVIVQANNIHGQYGHVQHAQGDVQAYNHDVTLNADWLKFNQADNHVTGGGHIILVQQYNVVKGQWVDYYMDLNRGTIRDAVVYNNESAMYASGKSIHLLNKNQLEIQDSYFTTCDPQHPAWHFSADTANFNYQDSQGSARNAKFYIESTAIFNLPYFQFPLGKRKSGFLVPDFGVINSRFANGAPNVGGFVGIPYYWNMAPNYDMTIEPRVYSTDGFMITDQFRYQTNTGSGILYTEQLPQDAALAQYRFYNHFTADHLVYPNLHVGIDYNQVSDNNYFVNFGNFNSTANNINLNQQFYAKYTPDWGLLQITQQSYQILQPAFQPTVAPIYGLSPQVTLNVKPVPIYAESGGLNIGLHSQYTNFTSVALQQGQRTVLYPSLTYPLQNQWGFIKPKFGWNYTNYQLSPYATAQNAFSVVDRNIPISSLDMGLIFDRPLTLGNSLYNQSVEPRLYYLNIPTVAQGNIPVFDTAPATYNINQLFSENRFIGDDRINSANDITVGINSTVTNNLSGNELFNYGIGYRYFITPQNQFLYGSPTQYAQLFLPQPNLITELNNKYNSALNSSVTAQYSTTYTTLDAYSAQLQYSPDKYKVINTRFSYQYRLPLLYYAFTPGQAFSPVAYENQYALDLSGQWPIYKNRWLLDGRVNYDFTFGNLINLVYGAEYNGGCWGIKALYENYLTNINQVNNAVFLVFELRGVATIGNGDPTTDLHTNIPGYVPLQTTPGYLSMTSIH